ncbi:DUF2809 domain-containing protein [Paucisalibacillus sp. EB02]|uniref:ribosomal maturation YjgA family protein n=1 Tax=Paucisalibacillus sp. EB02 TaxID=1347087 RepID=UPI0005A710DC|nr:DUF2809 domain-containing protein [Paucisalibacillus sp. EB02]
MNSYHKTIKVSENPDYRYLKIVYGIAIIITILFGLASRKYGYHLPEFIANHSGDALWAMMVYFGFRLFLVRGNMIKVVILSFLFSYGIEFSQLYQEEWINQIRSHSLGALILGRGFLFIDLVRYSIGILIAVIIDKVVLIWSSKLFSS